MPLRCKVFARLNNCANGDEVYVSFVQTQKTQSHYFLNAHVNQAVEILFSMRLVSLTCESGKNVQGPSEKKNINTTFICLISTSFSCYWPDRLCPVWGCVCVVCVCVGCGVCVCVCVWFFLLLTMLTQP